MVNVDNPHLEPEMEEKDLRVAHLSAKYLGRRIRLRAPRSSPAGSPVIAGELTRIDRQDIWHGNMRQLGYALTIAFSGRAGERGEVTLGPVPITYPILIGPE